MIINPSWSYRKIVRNLRTLRHDYERVLASFLYVRDQNDFIRATRDSLYVMNLEDCQKDRIWEYMNGYLSSMDTFLLFGFLDFDEED